jgi:hypothetical protein
MYTTTEKNTRIHGYDVNLEIEEDGPTSCYIGFDKWKYSGSLEFLLSYGELVDIDYGGTKSISQRTINRIEKWALDNGY